MNAKTKKILTGAGALALTAAISITGTVAYLTHITEQRANNFTFAVEGLDAMLTEPKWDGVVSYKYVGGKIYPTYGGEGENTIWGYTGGDPDQPVKSKEPPSDMTNITPPNKIPNPDYVDSSTTPDVPQTITPGYLEADKMTPGDVAGKNPFITNIGEMDEWVAAQVSFVYGEGSENAGKLIPDTVVESTIMPVIDVAWTSTDLTTGTIAGNGKWYYKGTALGENNYTNQMVFYYDKSLVAETQDKTAAIFESITLDKEATTTQVKKLEDIGGFAIYIQGFAVQESEFDNGSEWCKSSDVATFGNSPTTETGVTVNNPGIFGAPDKIS